MALNGGGLHVPWGDSEALVFRADGQEEKEEEEAEVSWRRVDFLQRPLGRAGNQPCRCDVGDLQTDPKFISHSFCYTFSGFFVISIWCGKCHTLKMCDKHVRLLLIFLVICTVGLPCGLSVTQTCIHFMYTIVQLTARFFTASVLNTHTCFILINIIFRLRQDFHKLSNLG